MDVLNFPMPEEILRLQNEKHYLMHFHSLNLYQEFQMKDVF